MRRLRHDKFLALVVLLPIIAHVQGCRDVSSVEAVKVSLQNGKMYQYPTVSGDEDGARIALQPQHYMISEIRRNAETNWVATFVYQPTAGFVGSDYAEIEVLTGSDGASAPTNIKKVAFYFAIHD